MVAMAGQPQRFVAGEPETAEKVGPQWLKSFERRSAGSMATRADIVEKAMALANIADR